MTVREMREMFEYYNDDVEVRLLVHNDHAPDGYEWIQPVGILPSGIGMTAFMVCTDDVTSPMDLFEHIKHSDLEDLYEGS